MSPVGRREDGTPDAATLADAAVVAGLFPGQGAQYVGMLEGFAADPGVRATLQEASDALGQDLWALIAEGPAERLNATVHTQPVMLATALAAYRAWAARSPHRLAVAAGHSLGELTAYTAAGLFDFADALRLVRRRAELMQACVPAGTGGMSAVIGLPGPQVDALCAACRDEGLLVEAVNFNEPSQTVIAGRHAGLEEAGRRCEAAGAKRVLPLPVSAPFHTSLLAPAGAALRAEMQRLSLREARFPVVNNVDGRARRAPAEVVDALARQASQPVRWLDGLHGLLAHGATIALEFGPGRTLGGFAKKAGLGLRVLPVGDAGTLDAALRTLDALDAPGVPAAALAA